MAMERSLDQLEADVRFLLCRFDRRRRSVRPRDYGISSDSIVAIAYGLIGLGDQEFPADEYDLAACEEMWKWLPAHRKSVEAVAAMYNARRMVLGDSMESAGCVEEIKVLLDGISKRRVSPDDKLKELGKIGEMLLSAICHCRREKEDEGGGTVVK